MGNMRFWESNKKAEINLKFSNKGVKCNVSLWIGYLEFENKTIGKEKWRDCRVSSHWSEQYDTRFCFPILYCG